MRTLANLRSAQGESADYGGMWKLVNGYLGVASIEDASQEQVDRAMVFVQDSIERETRNIIEGEYLARQTLPAAGADTIHYPLTRRFEEWQPHHMVGGDAMYHSDIRRLFQQLLDAARSGEPLMVSNIDNVREELQALTHLCEMRGIKQRAAEARLAHVENFVASLAETTGRLRSALTR
ncbi:hypothetical protein [Halomonas piscis]|uniref:hypothetical protein n=1 Tax=Halomonas piscis TaxID=3031727 RepID=UPI0028A1EEB9|nr:hypothetical protein [Halomonas piscis]